MCRCDKNIKSPYCNNCGTLIPKRAIKSDSVTYLLKTLWEDNTPQETTLRILRDEGYLITEGEVDLAYMLLDDLWFSQLEEVTYE